MEDIIQAISARYSRVPMIVSFPTSVFFLLHKGEEGWIAAGQQCKQSTGNPSEDA
jgi:hypothetical protein